jgi:hypothetical protein
MTAALGFVVRVAAIIALSTAGPPDRAFAGPPFVTDDPEPVPYQHFEFYTLITGTAVRGDTQGAAPGFEFNYGLVPNGQVHIIAPFTFDSPGGPTQFGYGDTELGVKYRFIDEDQHGSRPMVGAYPLIELPTGDEGRALGAGYVRAYFPIWIQKSFGDWTTYGGGGYWINHGDDTANRDYVYVGWLLQRQVTKQLAIGGEIFHQTATLSFGSTDPAATRPTTGFNIGAIYDLDEHNHLLASVGASLQNASTTNLFSWYLAYQMTGSFAQTESILKQRPENGASEK